MHLIGTPQLLAAHSGGRYRCCRRRCRSNRGCSRGCPQRLLGWGAAHSGAANENGPLLRLRRLLKLPLQPLLLLRLPLLLPLLPLLVLPRLPLLLLRRRQWRC